MKVNLDANGNGHIAFVRPSARTAERLAAEGPEATQAGSRNFIDGNLLPGMRASAALRQETPPLPCRLVYLTNSTQLTLLR